MGKFLDLFIVGGDWEKYQRIQFYKNMAKAQDKGNELKAEEMIKLNSGGKK